MGDFNLHHPLWGAPLATHASECFVEWLANSPHCLLNSVSPTHMAHSGAYSLIDLSLCSADLYAHT